MVNLESWIAKAEGQSVDLLSSAFILQGYVNYVTQQHHKKLSFTDISRSLLHVF